MLFMIVNLTRKDLSQEEMSELIRLAGGFYENMPSGITLHGDWAAMDGSRTYALLEADDPTLVEQIQEPFRPYVDMEVVPVERVKGWGKR
jgi:hypothetical protein